MPGMRVALAAMMSALLIGTAFAAEAPPGAAACSGCHAANPRVETPVPPIVGRPAADIAQAMTAFKAGQRSATVMDRIAKGFSDDEIQAIAAWLAAQR